MAVIITTKRIIGSGWNESVVGTDAADSLGVKERMTIAIVRFNKDAYDALTVNGKIDVGNAISNAIRTPTYS